MGVAASLKRIAGGGADDPPAIEREFGELCKRVDE
jgi:hypothetical protein